MVPPCEFIGFKTAAQPRGWVQHGDHWGLWWGNRQIASVQPGSLGVRVVLSCRKLWQNKEVRAASVGQGKRYPERWCAARVLEEVPLKEAVALLAANHEPSASSPVPRSSSRDGWMRSPTRSCSGLS